MKSLSVWTRDPFSDFDALIRSAFGAPLTNSFVPAAESHREGEDAVVRLELPGMELDDVTVEVVRGRLVIRGERRDPREGTAAEGEEGRVLRELRYGAFYRSFSLPRHVDADAVSASYDKGILTVRVAGAYRDDTARRIAITAA